MLVINLVFLRRRSRRLIPVSSRTYRTGTRFLQIYLTPRSPATNTSPINFSNPLANGTITLTDLNKILANAFATIYWYGMSTKQCHFHAPIDQCVLQPEKWIPVVFPVN